MTGLRGLAGAQFQVFVIQDAGTAETDILPVVLGKLVCNCIKRHGQV